MNKFLEILIGLILVVIPIILVTSVDVFFSWGMAALEFLKGAIVIGIVVIGILFIVIGISDFTS